MMKMELFNHASCLQPASVPAWAKAEGLEITDPLEQIWRVSNLVQIPRKCAIRRIVAKALYRIAKQLAHSADGKKHMKQVELY